MKLVAYTRGKVSVLLENSADLMPMTQLAVYPGVTKENIQKYEDNDDAIQKYDIQTKIMISN